jgi:hypothetical protein
MRWATSDPATLALSFSLYYALGVFYSFSFLFGTINKNLDGRSSLPLLYFHFEFSIIERVSHELVFHSNNQMREEGR